MLVGLTGGIGSGKSAVAQILAEHGAYVVDADAVAREIVQPGTPGINAVVAEFGAEVLAADGSLDRKRLAEIAFRSQESRSRLDAVVHPLIASRTAELFAQAPPDSIIVHDVPLLTELSLAGNYDAVIVVDAPDEIRIQRLRGRGLAEADVRARMAHQATREERLAIADYVINNDCSLSELEAQAVGVWAELASN